MTNYPNCRAAAIEVLQNNTYHCFSKTEAISIVKKLEAVLVADTPAVKILSREQSDRLLSECGYESKAATPARDCQPGEGDLTYYVEGKNAEYFEKLNNAAFAWQITRASQDIVDNNFGPIEEWMPITAMLDSAANRIKALATTPAIGGERWYLSSMNDGLFIINTPPRPSTENVWHDRSDGPTLVIPIHEMDHKMAQKICDAHNAALPVTSTNA